MYILGINPGSHESSACLVTENELIAAVDEERFTRTKHATNQMPWYSIQYCLHRAKITLEDIDYVAICWNSPYQSENSVHICSDYQVDKHKDFYYDQLFPRTHFEYTKLPKFAHVSHHLAHAASVYRTSDIDESAILVVDGQGDTVSTTLAHGKDDRIIILQQYDIDQSLGYFYQAITSFLGLGRLGSEGKTMGLSPYGNPVYQFPQIKIDTSGYSIDIGQLIPEKNATEEIISKWISILSQQFGNPRQSKKSYNLIQGRTQYLSHISAQDQDIAASAQNIIEKAISSLVKILLKSCNSSTLMLSGGVSLNCVTNQSLFHTTNVSELVLFPACADDGAAVGAATELLSHLGVAHKVKFKNPYLGPEFSNEAVEKTLKRLGVQYEYCQDPSYMAAEILTDNKIVAWFQGGMEFGPRALGNRSILANPSCKTMQDEINKNIKSRETWRPFGPSVLDTLTPSLSSKFESIFSPYMLRAIPLHDEAKKKLAAAIHVDGTARLQTVSREVNPKYFQLIEHFHKATGIPGVLNTSFNGNNEPIVCSPLDAIRTFSTTGLTNLFINNFHITGDN